MHLLLGLIGHPVSHSLSPPMHKAALAHYGLDGDYRLVDLPPDELADGIKRLISERYCGFNVTVPHKRSAAGFAGELTIEGKLLGAVNTVRINNAGNLVGHNTDLGGFMMALTESWTSDAPGERAIVMGAGGAARAAVWALIKLGWSQITVLSRNEQSADSLSCEVNAVLAARQSNRSVVVNAQQADGKPGKRPHLVVNCTPVGLIDNEVPDWMERQISALGDAGLFYDMVYRRMGDATPLVAGARARDIAAVDGIAMLVHQAALAFNFWTGKPGPVDVMKAALIK